MIRFDQSASLSRQEAQRPEKNPSSTFSRKTCPGKRHFLRKEEIYSPRQNNLVRALSCPVDIDFDLKLQKLLIQYESSEYSPEIFKKIEEVIGDRLQLILKKLNLPLAGPWSELMIGKVHRPTQQKHNAQILEEFCKEANTLSRIFFDNVSSNQERHNLMCIVENIYIDLVNATDKFFKSKNGEMDFVAISGYLRSPEFMTFDIAIKEDLKVESCDIFSRAEIKEPRQEIMTILSDIFGTVNLRLNQNLWQYAVYKDLGFDKDTYAYVYASAIPSISSTGTLETQDLFGDQSTEEDILVAHEMAHVILNELGYVDDNDLESYFPNYDRSNVHELITSAVEMQLAPMPTLYTLLKYDLDHNKRYEMAERLLFQSIETFLSKYNTCYNEIVNGFFFDSDDERNHRNFVKCFDDAIGVDGRQVLEEFLAKRFRSKAHEVLNHLKSCGAFDGDALFDLQHVPSLA